MLQKYFNFWLISGEFDRVFIFSGKNAQTCKRPRDHKPLYKKYSFHMSLNEIPFVYAYFTRTIEFMK